MTYARDARKPGEITTTEAARMLNVHPRTVRRWAVCTVHDESSPLNYVRKDPEGRYWLSRADIRKVAAGRIEIVIGTLVQEELHDIV